ncbi:uncharacterized protein LOC142584553 [Dermacentor variabilis]|uniref:uncharacterized protein LOC142584553 n=1 Tax=Dermacentor variabilis TaxID=34621 RepID=UPI003F5C632B
MWKTFPLHFFAELPRWPASSSQGNHCPALVSQLHHQGEAPSHSQSGFSVQEEQTDQSLLASIRKEISSATRSILKDMAVLKTQNEAILNLLGNNRECEMDEQPVQTYPLRTVDEIDHLEGNLKSSSSTRRQLCKVLGHIGGNTLRSTTSNILKYLLHDSVAVMYSLHGQKGKRALAETELCRIILGKRCASVCKLL